MEPGFRVVHLDAGPAGLAKEALPEMVEPFTRALLADLADRPADVIHANYWLSGVVGHRVKHALELPLVSTFHTLARVKAETGDSEPQRRIDAETEVVGCSDVILANSIEEVDQLQRHYGADPTRIELVPPGVEHAFFSPETAVGRERARPRRRPHPALRRSHPAPRGSTWPSVRWRRCGVPMPAWWWSVARAAPTVRPNWPAFETSPPRWG